MGLINKAGVKSLADDCGKDCSKEFLYALGKRIADLVLRAAGNAKDRKILKAEDLF